MHDYDNYRFYVNGEIIKLTETENELLDLFLINKNRIVTRDMICQRLYFENYKEHQYHTICKQIKKIREKLGLHIITIRWRGYCLKD